MQEPEKIRSTPNHCCFLYFHKINISSISTILETWFKKFLNFENKKLKFQKIDMGIPLKDVHVIFISGKFY